MALLIPANLATRPDVPRSLRQAAQAFRDWLGNDVTVTLHPGHTPETSEAAPAHTPRGGNLAVVATKRLSGLGWW